MKRKSVLILVSVLAFVAPAFSGNALAASSNQSVADLVKQLQGVAAKKADPMLKSLAGEWSDKIKSLGKSVGNNPEVQSYMATAVKSVLGDNGPAAMAALQKLGSVQVTPEQLGLAKEVVNLGGAYLTQENFAGLEGSESEVTKIVNSLRKGDYSGVVGPLKSIAGNAKLTDQQKQMASSMLETYVPGAGEAKEMLKKIPGL